MKNIIRNIVLVVVTMLFLVLSTGLNLTVHYCSTINYTGLHLFKTVNDPCEHPNFQEPEICCQSPDKNGSSTSATSDCCTDTTIYLAFDDHVNNTDQISLNSKTFAFFPLSSVILIGEKWNYSFGTSFFKPPQPLPGNELFCLNRQLLL